METTPFMEPFEDYCDRHPEITVTQAEYLKPIMEKAAYEEYAFVMSYIFM